MKSLMLFYVGILTTVRLTAQIAGPLSGGTFVNVPIAGSNKAWTSVGNVASSDNTYATFGNLTGGTGSFTDYLTATNFGFSIPSGASVDGIVVEVERSDPNFRTSDYSVKIIKGGAISTTERSGGATYPAADSYQTYGNPADLWGETWTDVDINSSNFGVAVAARRNSAGGTTGGRIDHVRITVFYNFITLPLKLLDFSLQKNANSVHLDWKTAEEVNMDHFEIERSQTARDFVSIGTIADRNQITETNYSFDDNYPLKDISFYRLKMVSNTGGINYSKILPVQFRGGRNVGLYPVPWRQGMPLNIINPNYERLTVQFFNEWGQLIGTNTTTTNQVAGKSLSGFEGWGFYKIYDEKYQLVGVGKILVQ